MLDLIYDFLLTVFAALPWVPLAFFLGGCPCCGCPSFSDTFTRSDDTDIGANWTEVAGDWSISSNALTTSSTSAIAIATYEILNGTGIVSVTLNGSGSDRRIAIVIGAYTDTNNYIWGSIDYESAATGWIRLYERAGGSDTLLQELDSGYSTSAASIQLCWNGQNASLAVTTNVFAGPRYVSGNTTLTGTKAGVGTGGTASNIVFDGFTFTGNRVDAAACAACNSCLSNCTGGDLPDTIEVTMSSGWVDTVGCTTCDETFNGQTFVLDRLVPTSWETFSGPPGTYSISDDRSCLFQYDGAAWCGGNTFQVSARMLFNGSTWKWVVHVSINAPSSSFVHYIGSNISAGSCAGQNYSVAYNSNNIIECTISSDPITIDT